MITLLVVFVALKYGLAMLPPGPPVPAGVNVYFAGEVDEFRKIGRRSGPAVDLEAPISVLIVRLSCGKYAILLSPNSNTPFIDILQLPLPQSTVIFPQPETLTVQWEHKLGDDRSCYQVTLCSAQDLRAFVQCLQRNKAEAPSDADIKSDAGTEDEIVEEMSDISANFRACLEYGAFADELTWTDIRQTCWVMFMAYLVLRIVFAVLVANRAPEV
ncbi:uncharacterized protein B0H18DRAFT_1120444 [Fomitopsis serialis]|uniref:uncharacterized protein n=1 Tax=Fomitopsis serialis TaxID=139415 RepID=UPI002007BDF8|nr:uncharacterized protein B0H18DRAFT_1120444 [Neoantrodia serialis]KAH9923343.1 hypothetical protein B0H18DRAFT_1120444 [Neoantrodia serialis]